MKYASLSMFFAACIAGNVYAAGGEEHHGEPQWWILMLLFFQCIGIAVLAQRRYLVRKNGEIKPAYTELQEFSLFLLGGTIVAQLWAHGDGDGYAATMHAVIASIDTWMGRINLSPHFLVDEVFMAFFFGIAAKELTEAFLKEDGALRGSKGILPMVGCLGGVIGPAVVFRLICSPERADAWAVPCATDIAFSWLGARAIWGAKHPAVIFLLALAVADDFIGMGIIAAFYPQRPFDPIGIGILVAGMATAYGFRRMSKVNGLFQWWPAYLIPAALCWIGLFQAGLHAALALVFIVPFMPMSRKHDPGFFEDEEHKHENDTITAFEHAMKPFVDGGLFFFGLAAAGVAWLGTGAWDRDSWAVFLGLGIGKLIGICLFTVVGFCILRLFGFKQGLPAADGLQMQWKDLPILGLLGAMGFTVALFVAGAAGGHADLKLGALASFFYLGLAIVIGKIVHRKPLPASAYSFPAPKSEWEEICI